MRRAHVLIIGIVFTVLLLALDPFQGMTLFSPWPPGFTNNWEITTRLVDNELNTINTWTHQLAAAQNPYLLADSTLLYPYRVAEPPMNASGVGGGLQLLSWQGNIIWEMVIASDSIQLHHDIEPMPNGNILCIAWERKTAEEANAMGRLEIENLLNEFWVDMILEIDPTLPEGENIVWQWRFWDHLIQDVDPSLPGYGAIVDHPELLDINFGTIGAGMGSGLLNGDWLHTNGIQYNAKRDQIVISSRNLGELYIIDHSTTSAEAASHSGGDAGMGGDLLYRWGNPAAYGRGTAEDQQLVYPHSVNWIPQYHPGEGNLLLYNNGYGSFQSAVMELVPPLNEDHTYHIDPDEAYGPAEATIVYSDNIYSPILSGAQRLPNGNTLMTVAVQKRIVEVNSNGIIQWDYTYNGNSNVVPRALKYDIDYLVPNTLGDVNGDGGLDILDLVHTVAMIMGEEELVDGADMNDDGITDILDIVLQIQFILYGTPRSIQ